MKVASLRKGKKREYPFVEKGELWEDPSYEIGKNERPGFTNRGVVKGRLLQMEEQ